MKTPYKYIQITIACSSQLEAEKIACGLVTKKLVACAQIFPVISTYHWNGLQQDPEILLKGKTVMNKLEAIKSYVTDQHSYDVPELIALPIIGGSEAYLEWVEGEVRDEA